MIERRRYLTGNPHTGRVLDLAEVLEPTGVGCQDEQAIDRTQVPGGGSGRARRRHRLDYRATLSSSAWSDRATRSSTSACGILILR